MIYQYDYHYHHYSYSSYYCLCFLLLSLVFLLSFTIAMSAVTTFAVTTTMTIPHYHELRLVATILLQFYYIDLIYHRTSALVFLRLPLGRPGVKKALP